MRLLHSTNLTLHEFFGDKIPKYAILSHRWEEDEVTFQDLNAGRGPEMAGWEKVLGCCARAVLEELKYVWIDCCCIDKSSSAELSEAITSMFAWYKKAVVCYVYLSDVTDAKLDHSVQGSEFRNSRWFTRGWTLQELLAPSYVDFFTKDWVWMGSKSILSKVIQDVTRIRNLWDYKNASVAQKMSWAAERQTTRIEDQAYALLGLFEVYMPPLYGEGSNAFIRLQVAILEKIDDDSIFAWHGPLSAGRRGLLAPSPRNFLSSSNIVRSIINPDKPPHTMTSKGLGFQFFGKSDQVNQLSAILECAWEISQPHCSLEKIPVMLHLSRLDTNGPWLRDGNLKPYEQDTDLLAATTQQNSEEFHRKLLYVQQLRISTNLPSDHVRVVWKSKSDLGFTINETQVHYPNESNVVPYWSYKKPKKPAHNLHDFRENGSVASIEFENSIAQRFRLLLGILDGRLWIDIAIPSKEDMTIPEFAGAYVNGGPQDRVSRACEFGSINASIHNTNSPRRVVKVSIDSEGVLRWPSYNASLPRQLRELTGYKSECFSHKTNFPAGLSPDTSSDRFETGDEVCDHRICQNQRGVSARADQLRDHYRDAHQEDIGAYQGRTLRLPTGEVEVSEKQWWAGRIVSPTWWRCDGCLTRCTIADDGWRCSVCKNRCHKKRINFRLALKDEIVVDPEDSCCVMCKGIGLLKAGVDKRWEICAQCRGDAYRPRSNAAL